MTCPTVPHFSKGNCSLTLSKYLPYGEEVPRDHHVLEFGLEFLTHTEVPNCRQEPLKLLCV